MTSRSQAARKLLEFATGSSLVSLTKPKLSESEFNTEYTKYFPKATPISYKRKRDLDVLSNLSNWSDTPYYDSRHDNLSTYLTSNLLTKRDEKLDIADQRDKIQHDITNLLLNDDKKTTMHQIVVEPVRLSKGNKITVSLSGVLSIYDLYLQYTDDDGKEKEIYAKEG